MTGAAIRRLLPVVVAALVAASLAVLGATLTQLDAWYYALDKPDWKPPDWAFGPVWTTIFTLTALAAADSWRRRRAPAERRLLLALFIVNAVLNVAWSALFFALKRPDWALMEVGFLWLSVVVLILALQRIAASTAWLLVPYLVWVSLAAVLNFEIVRMNAPFSPS